MSIRSAEASRYSTRHGPARAGLDRASLREGGLVVLAFACLSVIATYPLVLNLGRALPGDLGDPLFTSWLLGWDADRLRHGLQGFWDAPILFPSRHTVAFSEHMLGIATFVAPIVWLIGNAILAYNVAFLLTYVLAGAGMYLLAREIAGRRDAAFLAGLAFAFGPMRALHVSHLQVLAWGWMPIALWGLHRFFATLNGPRGVPTTKHTKKTTKDTNDGSRDTFRQPGTALAVFVAAFAIQALSNGYFLYYLALASAFVVVYELASTSAPAAARLRALGTLAAASTIILAVVGAVALAYLAVRREYGFQRPYEDWTMFSADVRSYVSVVPSVRLWSALLNGDAAPERQLFPGLVTAMLAAAALWPGGLSRLNRDHRESALRRGRRRRAILYAALGATAFVLSLGPEPLAWSRRLMPSGPYLWLARIVPGMDGLRVPARLGVVVLMSLSVLAALGAVRVLARLRPRARLVATAALGVAMIAEGWAAPLRIAAFDARGRSSERAAYRWLAAQAPGAAIELPILEWAIAPTLTYQYATLFHGHPVVNGYSGYGSPLQAFLGGAASPLADLDRMEQALDLLRAVGVRYVIVHPRDYADPAVGADTVAAIRARPALTAGEFRDGEVVAFRLRDGGAPGPDAGEAPPGGPIAPAGFHADASDAADRLPFLFDGDPDTRWLTGRAQSGDEFIRIAFDRARDVSRIDLQTAARSFGDYPRELLVEGIGEDGSRSVLFQGPMLVPYGRALAAGGPLPAIRLRLPPNRTRTVIIRQTGRARTWFWSVHELVMWER